MTEKRPTFLGRLRDIKPCLSPAEKRLAEFLDDFPGEIASYAASELAALARVSNSTVTRLIQHMGYSSYEAAKRHARQEKLVGSRFYLARASVTQQTGLVSHLERSIENLEQTFLAITDSQIDAVVNTVLNSNKIWVAGYRSSHPFASYLQWQLLQVVENVVAIPGPGQTMAEYIASMSPRDMVIVFAARRRVESMDAILNCIAKRQATILYISDESAPLQRSAQWHLYCHTITAGPIFNHVAVLALCHLIISRAIEKAGKNSRKRLREIEAIGDTLREL